MNLFICLLLFQDEIIFVQLPFIIYKIIYWLYVTFLHRPISDVDTWFLIKLIAGVDNMHYYWHRYWLHYWRHSSVVRRTLVL